jgi:site-specific recombinase XerD
MVIVTETKTGEQRTIGLPKSTQAILHELKHKVDTGLADSDQDGIVFLNHNGGRMDAHGVTRRLNTFCNRAGIEEISSHILRHTSATMVLEATGDIHATSKLLGHKSINLTSDTYGHLLEGRRSEMADVLDESISSASYILYNL